MPKSRASSRSKPPSDEQDRAAGSPPGQAEVERAIERILDRLKPKAPKTSQVVAR